MNRRDWLQLSAALGIGASLSRTAVAAPAAAANAQPGTTGVGPATAANPLPVPADGVIPVAVLISAGAVLIDFVGPWEVFESVRPPGRDSAAFHLYTVAESAAPVRASGGMMITPNYTFADAPAPKVIVIPAQSPPTDAVLAWVRKVAQRADLTMSVCTGAFVLAKTGLLSGKEATTHHNAYKDFAMTFPDVRLKRGARFVDLGNIASAGGLTSGIDLALHVVERYFGRDTASAAAYYLEYQGQGWTDPSSNSVYAQERPSTDAHPLCPVCNMDVDVSTAPKSTYREKTYYFCMQSHKRLFDSNPGQFLGAVAPTRNHTVA
jgi:putative intracellular protease/amidase/YHS domain-containing protein